MNSDWKYQDGFNAEYTRDSYDDASWQIVDLPHNPSPVPLHYLDERRIWRTCTYRKALKLAARDGWENVIRFNGVGNKATLYFNGKQLSVHEGGYTPFSVVLPDESGLLCVKVETEENPLIPPFGGGIDYLVFGGIYRTVSLFSRPKDHIEFLSCASSDGKNVAVRGKTNGIQSKKECHLVLKDEEKEIAQVSAVVEKGAFSYDFGSLSLELWDLKHPKLYTLVAEYEGYETVVSFGCRKAEFTFNGFLLNGRKIKLVGLNRHQCYPYVGYAMPENMQRHDVDVLKGLGVNIVRTSHYLDDPSFLAACDEKGLLVLEEIPGWQTVSDHTHWRELCVRNVSDMITRDVNHPSIVLWGVRINESQDDDALYAKTNEVAHELDPVRQTCGVRNFTFSHLLEDVYTYNDFSHKGDNRGLLTPKVNAPYLVTEHNGHMFPTKRYDPQRVRTGQFLRHMSVLESAFKEERISGCIGWCLADYQTHSNFGSGDNICYHGVCDQHRVPKFGAYAYISQQDKYPVLVCGTTFDRGDEMASEGLPIAVATNCQSVRLYHDGVFVKTFYPDRKGYPHVPHPPVFIDDVIGETICSENGFGGREGRKLAGLLTKMETRGASLSLIDKLQIGALLKRHKLQYRDAVFLSSKYTGIAVMRKGLWRLDGIIDDKVVCFESYGPDLKTVIKLTPSATRLSLGDGYQVCSLILSIGKEGMTLPSPFAFLPYTVQLEGPVALLSPVMDCTEGGVGGIYVRTMGEKGKAVVTVTCDGQVYAAELNIE